VIRAVSAIVLVVACLLGSATIKAHGVVEQVVDMLVQPRGDRLLVRLHVPATVVADARLPHLDDGTLDTTAIDEPLRILAAHIARNLDIQQADDALMTPTTIATVNADRRSVDVDLTYSIDAGTAGISARLNAFQAIGQPVRTNARFQPSSEREYVVSVTGAPVRVLFDPNAFETVQQFIARGLQAVFDGGDHLLFLFGLVLAVRRARTAASLFAAMMAGHAVAILSSFFWPATTAAWLPALAMVGASTIVIAALQNIVGARLEWIGPLAIAFGVLNGFSFGNTLVRAQQFAGSHREIALVTFLVVVMAGQLWWAALMWVTRTWLDGVSVPQRIVTVVASGLLAHSAVHRAVDRGHAVAQTGSFGAEHALELLTLGWVCVVAVAIAVEALRHRRIDDGPGQLTNPVQA
jgi:hypothetical protein